jgi:geranylgeranyl pyrophosphate synthase
VSANAAAEQLAGVLERGGPRLRGLLAATERRLGEVAESYGEVLAAHAGDTLAAGGKRLRPILLFIVAGKAEGGELVEAGAAVELLHMATLVHDDVLDRADLRRGRPTVFARGGRGAAIATGDLLF